MGAFFIPWYIINILSDIDQIFRASLFRYLQENKLTTLPDGLFGALSKLKVL